MNTNLKIPVVDKKLIVPFILITSLFALWGFANSVTDPMVQAFKKVLELSNSQAAWVQMAFYGGYFCMALPAALFVRKYTYKYGIIMGLSLYSIGALLFYPAAVTQEFWFFCLGLYVLTFGLAFLETTANPYILAMGHPKTAIRRLNLAQAFNPVGLVLGLLVAKFFVLDQLQSDDYENFAALDQGKKALIRTSDLLVVRDPYVILGLVVLAVLVIILISKMPQAKDSDGDVSLKKTFSSLLKNKRYSYGVLSLVMYMGAQIMCWTYIYQYAEGMEITASIAANYQLLAFILFTIGRIIGTYLLKFISSTRLLMYFAFAGLFCALLTVFSGGVYGLYALASISFFLSIMFPTIYGIALEGLKEEETKIGAAGLVMAIVGGALLPQFQAMIIDIGGVGVDDIKIFGVPEVNFSFVLPAVCFLVVIIYAWNVIKRTAIDKL
ncbi:L-fucose transporter [Galbibacter marinus]|uniref:L-fucose transporter n=1 Tax=Galbibacter marinus TaxID=555500 RepID=K2PNB9_9FLAO|nr:L-fucose:H+ symporter permease [Galbibacter marinus]EKF54045.1 L-fucose transporter [Galbibacter marinus]